MIEKETLKNKTTSLRKLGWSYNRLSRKFKIPKGTLSYWFRNLKESEVVKNKNINNAKLKWAKNITRYNEERSRLARIRWSKQQELSSTELKTVNDYELKIIGAALYWAEGYKRGNWSVVFCNSDPEMVKVIMKFFIKICEVPRSKIKAQIQIHRNISEPEAIAYWSKISGIPRDRFSKSTFPSDKSSKGRRRNNLPYGTLRIKINDVVLVNKIKGWIRGIIKNI